MPVNSTHPSYDKHHPDWELCDDVIDGERKVHEKREKYLPRLAEETDEAYNARLAMTPFFGATERTLLGLHGMILRKPAVMDGLERVALYLQDVTLGGESLEQFVAEVLEEDLTTDRCGILVDHPPSLTGEAITQAKAETLGLRPTLARYGAEDILNWRYSRINNARVLVLVVLKESAEVWEDEFKAKKEERYRVLDLTQEGYRQRLFRIKEGKEEQLEVAAGQMEVYPTMGGKRMSFIPFDVDPDIDSPPLLALAQMNIHHYQRQADYENGCHLSGLPTTYITGWSGKDSEGNPAKIYVGGPVANVLPPSEAMPHLIEVKGDFGALKENLDSKKQEMAILGARMLEAPRTGVEAAETASIHRKGEESILATIARKRSERMTRVLRWFTAWAGFDPSGVRYELNRDFYPTPLSPQLLTAFVGGMQAGAWSHEAVFYNLQARDFYPPGSTFEEEQARIGNAGPTPLAAPPGGTAAPSA